MMRHDGRLQRHNGLYSDDDGVMNEKLLKSDMDGKSDMHRKFGLHGKSALDSTETLGS